MPNKHHPDEVKPEEREVATKRFQDINHANEIRSKPNVLNAGATGTVAIKPSNGDGSAMQRQSMQSMKSGLQPSSIRRRVPQILAERDTDAQAAWRRHDQPSSACFPPSYCLLRAQTFYETDRTKGGSDYLEISILLVRGESRPCSRITGQSNCVDKATEQLKNSTEFPQSRTDCNYDSYSYSPCQSRLSRLSST